MAKKPGPAKNGYVLPTEKFKQREKVFGLYRDMGIGRSILKLHQLLHETYPELAVARSSLETWSRAHDWADRVKAFDFAAKQGAMQARSRGRASAAAPAMVMPISADGSFDQIGTLLTAANQALTRAMNATPVVTRPGDVKSLVDAARRSRTSRV